MVSLTVSSACRTGSLTGSSTLQLNTPAPVGTAIADSGPDRPPRPQRFPSQRPNTLRHTPAGLDNTCNEEAFDHRCGIRCKRDHFIKNVAETPPPPPPPH
ncbi:hypothetical protein GCM10010252_13000 [Streptomyces aureoverticillatus]|nr:hypothetical protein GCM10010252_13000 [Streptomyces aureoverticillatus]